MGCGACCLIGRGFIYGFFKLTACLQNTHFQHDGTCAQYNAGDDLYQPLVVNTANCRALSSHILYSMCFGAED